jgi:hypothetical protein
MDTESAPATRSRAEWARITQDARRLARFKAGLERAERIVAGEPKLTGEQLAVIEAVFADARAEASS